MKYCSRFLLFISCVLWALGVHSEIFRWTDSNGKVHFGDHPPIEANTTEVDVKVNTIESPSIEGFQEVVKSNDKVVMYSASWCGVCKKAKHYFDENEVRYKEYDIERSEKGKRDYKRLKGTGVPIILVGDQRMNGFSASTFESLYRPK